MNELRRLDESIGVVYPWYTFPCLDAIATWDVSSWDVFEYGAGYSTSWWRCKAKSVTSVDGDQSWATRFRAHYETEKTRYIETPLRTGTQYDCVIIDGEPVTWRDECTAVALRVVKPGGRIIIDNYKQASVDLSEWPQTDVLLRPFPCKIYHHPGHRDWKTAVWMITETPSSS